MFKASNDKYIEMIVKDPLYRINEDGSVYSLITRTGKISAQSEWRRIDYSTKRTNYKLIRYKRKRLSLHRIVYRRWVGNLNENLVINHIDSDPSNNHFKNLEQITHSKNILHSYKKENVKINICSYKINLEIANEIRLNEFNLSYSKLAKKYSLSKSTISYIVKNLIWKNDNNYSYERKTPSHVIRAGKSCLPHVDVDKIIEFYKNKPKGMTVDHIIPLENENVCGLHVIDNLQYLSLSEN